LLQLKTPNSGLLNNARCQLECDPASLALQVAGATVEKNGLPSIRIAQAQLADPD